MAILHTGLLCGDAARLLCTAVETSGGNTPKEADSNLLIYNIFFKSIQKVVDWVVNFFSFKSVTVIHHSKVEPLPAPLPEEIAYQTAKDIVAQTIRQTNQYKGCSTAFANALAEWKQGLQHSLIQQEYTQLENAKKALEEARKQQREGWQTRSMSDLPSAGIETQEANQHQLSKTL